MSEQTREISIMGIRNRAPELSHAEARAVLLRRMIGDQLYQAAYGRVDE